MSAELLVVSVGAVSTRGFGVAARCIVGPIRSGQRIVAVRLPDASEFSTRLKIGSLLRFRTAITDEGLIEAANDPERLAQYQHDDTERLSTGDASLVTLSYDGDSPPVVAGMVLLAETLPPEASIQ